MKTVFLSCVLFIMVAVISNAEDFSSIDYAVKAAAEKTINEITATSQTAGVRSIAFIGFKNDSHDYSLLFRSALSADAGRFSFYTRENKELDRLVGEIEFGDRRGDVMSKETIQKFGKITGVQALLYGRINNVQVDSKGNARFSVSLVLSEVETGRDLWGGMITGNYRVREAFKAVSPEITKAAMNAGKRLYDKLMFDEMNFPECNIFIMPFLGNDASAISEIIASELNHPGNGRISLYSQPAKLDSFLLEDFYSDVKGNLPTLSSGQLSKLNDMLIKEYNVNPKAVGMGKYGNNRINAYLQGTVTNIYHDNINNTQNIIINVQVRNLSNNRMIWSKTVEGSYKIPETNQQSASRFWEQNKTMVIFAGSIIVAIIVLILLIFFIKSMTRAR